MASSMWKVNISFGLVNIPVRLYTAIDTKKHISFNQLDSTQNSVQEMVSSGRKGSTLFRNKKRI